MVLILMQSQFLASDSIMKMKLGQGISFKDFIDDQKHVLLENQAKIFRNCPDKAKRVFERTWAKLEGEWVNWGWRATIMLIAKEQGFWDTPFMRNKPKNPILECNTRVMVI